MSLQIEDYSTNSTETSPANTKRLNSTNVNDLLKKKKLQKGIVLYHLIYF